MHFLAIARIERMRHRLIAVARIGALIVDLDDDAGADGEAVGGKPVALRGDVPALAAALADAGDDAGGGAVDAGVGEGRAAGEGEVVGGCEAGAVVAGCGWAAGYRGAAAGVPGEGGGEDRVRVGLGEGGAEEEEGGEA